MLGQQNLKINWCKHILNLEYTSPFVVWFTCTLIWLFQFNIINLVSSYYFYQLLTSFVFIRFEVWVAPREWLDLLLLTSFIPFFSVFLFNILCICYNISSAQYILSHYTWTERLKLSSKFLSCTVKSQSPIYFVKNRHPDLLCNDFLIKMYRPLQNYTFDIYTLW